MARDADYIRLIRTARWQHLRRAALEAHPLCVRCERKGVTRSATVVHHIEPVEEALFLADKVRLMFDPANLMPLCDDCHVEVHTEMGRSGKEAAKKRNERHAEQIARRFF